MSGKKAAGRIVAASNKQAHQTKAGGGKGGDRRSSPTNIANKVSKKTQAKGHRR